MRPRRAARNDDDAPTTSLPMRPRRAARNDDDAPTTSLPLAGGSIGRSGRNQVRSRKRGRVRARRVAGLATGAVLALGVAAVVVAPHIGTRSASTVSTTLNSGPRPSASTAQGARPATASPTGPTRRQLGGPIAITAPRVTTTSPKLTWAPPKLVNPLTETVSPGHRSLKLDPARDYRVVLPKTPVNLGGGVTITGGHNVVIIGGIIQIPPRSQVPEENDRRGLYLKSQTGTIHIEGVHLTGDLSDGFNLAEDAGGVVQIENVWIDLVHGGKDAHHADVIQTWAGPRILRVDGLRAATQYQGFFLLPNQHYTGGAPESFTFRRTVLTMMPDCGYALWLPEGRSSWLDSSGITVRTSDGVATDKLSWPDSALGLKVVGPQAAVDLPSGTPGPGYVSPGYA